MAMYELNRPVYTDSNTTSDFYIEKCHSMWYVIAVPIGTNAKNSRNCVASFSTLKVCKEAVQMWKNWVKF